MRAIRQSCALTRLTPVWRACSTAGVASADARTHAASADGKRPAASVDAAEQARFAALAGDWWDQTGPLQTLHRFNAPRVEFMRTVLCDWLRIDEQRPRPFAGMSFLDVGCGGGLLAEPLTRLGGHVHGIDLAPESIEVARAHAEQDAHGLAGLRYEVTTAEELAARGELYDVVVASEVIEHTADPAQFVRTLAQLARPGGAVVVSSLNRTPASFLKAIVAAEYVARVVPRGTHTWERFLTPGELAMAARRCGLHLHVLSGIAVQLSSGHMFLADSLDTNYIALLVHDSG